MFDFAKIQPGDRVSIKKTITAFAVEEFARLSGDTNPLHLDADFARRAGMQRRVAHGMLVASYVSTLIGVHLPGPGALWTQQNFRWRAPVFVGDELEISLIVTHKSEGTHSLAVRASAANQNGVVVMEGEGVVMVLAEREQTTSSPPPSERIGLVTGGSRGIGAAIARRLSNAGIYVVVNYLRRAADAEQVCHAIASQGGQAIALQADVVDADSVQQMVARARQVWGRPIDILVNSAGAPIHARPFLDTPWTDLQIHFDVQVQGTFNCCRAVLPAMQEQKSGCIVNIGSIHAWNVPPAQLTGYVVAKAALNALTRAMALELGPMGIRVNMVSPGMTETELIADVPERLRQVHALQTPLRRLAAPADVAQMVDFLCSDTAKFITGADIPVCGGIRM